VSRGFLDAAKRQRTFCLLHRVEGASTLLVEKRAVYRDGTVAGKGASGGGKLNCITSLSITGSSFAEGGKMG